MMDSMGKMQLSLNYC